jgi:hypothetical protein
MNFWRAVTEPGGYGGPWPAELEVQSVVETSERLWQQTVSDTASGGGIEWAAMLVLDAEDTLHFQQEVQGTAESVRLRLDVASDQTLVGVFHTHTTLRVEGAAVGFGPDDVVGLINDGYAVSLIRSGDWMFAFMRTRATLPRVEREEVVQRFQETFRHWLTREGAVLSTIIRAGLSLSQVYHLAVYIGPSTGPLGRIYVP